MAKHTPGPWTISSESLKPDHTPAIGITAPGKWINLAGVYSTKRGDASRANARLIAAAPDLFKALQELLDAVYCGGDPDGSRTRAAENALKKATGGGDDP